MNMRKHLNKLSITMIRRNRAFTIGLFILMLTMGIICTLSSSLASSVKGSLSAFMKNANMPDAWITTSLAPVSHKEEIRKIEGVDDVTACIVTPAVVRFLSGKMNSLTLFTLEEDDFRKYYIAEEAEPQDRLPNVWVTVYYAKKNGVAPGSTLSLKTPEGYEDVYVSALVSLPESISCTRRETSWSDSADYGYLYMQRKDADCLFGTSGYADQWVIRLRDTLTTAEKEEVLDKASSVFKNGTKSVLLFETSSAKALVDDMMLSIDAVCNNLPTLLYTIGLIFMVLFIGQIMRDQQKMIGLLSALGHSGATILMIFIRYALLLLIPALALGIFGGIIGLSVCCRIFQNIFALPQVIYRMDIGMYLPQIALIVLSCILSCILSVGEILKADPARSYSGTREGSASKSAFLKKLKINSYVKYGLVSVLRNKKRFLLSILAITACIAVTAGALEYYLAYREAEPRTFGKRYTYDMLVGISEGERSVSDVRKIGIVEKAEPLLSFTDTVRFGEKEYPVKVTALSDDSELIVPLSANDERAPITDGVVLDEWTAKQIEATVGDTVLLGETPLAVTGINRGLVDRTEYISFDTAYKMGYTEPDTVAVKLVPGGDPDEFCRQAAEIDGYEYTSSLEKQHEAQSDNTHVVSLTIRLCMSIAFVMGFILIFNIVSVSVSERRTEFAVLLALGIPDGRFALIVGTEQLLIFVPAVLLSIPITYRGADIINAAISTPRQVVEMYAFKESMAVGIGLALLYLIAAILVAVGKIRAIDPAVAINQDE